ncbi:NAD-dependent epimerase/dehydratase family protein [uncultured Maribacter sp.]|uniref:NAD-dependent epimerase/dehydratase family protein n=1 Tax=uncultured Maribacter sp. TaxID=431308 RepID=UPI00261F7CCD|nr:NAD-dependent epimerase/dehydratase family protein [uncultured Maribacter sp.]
MKILITGVAGFIGHHTAQSLIKQGNEVVDLEHINDYYDVNLKYARLKKLGIEQTQTESFNQLVFSEIFKEFKFFRCKKNYKIYLQKLFKEENITISLFTNAVIKSEPIRVCNNGKRERDFTFIEDITLGIRRALKNNLNRKAIYKVYNNGNNNSVKLPDFITCIEQNLDKVAEKYGYQC